MNQLHCQGIKKSHQYFMHHNLNIRVTNFHNVLSLLVPCAPGNISTELVCGTNDLTVSWNSSAILLSYSVTARPLDGTVSPVTCSTNSTSCSLSSLQCGQTYNITVKASSGGCSGPCSTPQFVETGNKNIGINLLTMSINS